MHTLSTSAIDTMRNLSLALQRGPDGFLAEARRYVDAARAQLDIAIAEGQVAAAQTRKELEERFNAAKENPRSARSAFMSPERIPGAAAKENPRSARSAFM